MSSTKIISETVVDKLDMTKISPGISRLRINLISDGMGDPIQVPIIILNGKTTRPVLGITAAVHGNELNGIPLIHDLINKIDVKKLNGTIVAVPVVNIPSYLANSRFFSDGSDLNRIFPGKSKGSGGKVYAYHFMNKIAKKFDYLIDLHTASFGRENSLYVRADITKEKISRMSYLMNPQIIVCSKNKDGTLRGALSNLGIDAITVEVGNPHRFQKKLINSSVNGLLNILGYLGMIKKNYKFREDKTIICKNSYWIYSDQGGILEVLPDITEIVKKNQIIAQLKNVYGDIITTYKAPERGIVIGKNINPIENAGSRILHLGIIG